jgi:cell division protein FtsB
VTRGRLAKQGYDIHSTPHVKHARALDCSDFSDFSDRQVKPTRHHMGCNHRVINIECVIVHSMVGVSSTRSADGNMVVSVANLEQELKEARKNVANLGQKQKKTKRRLRRDASQDKVRDQSRGSRSCLKE